MGLIRIENAHYLVKKNGLESLTLKVMGAFLIMYKSRERSRYERMNSPVQKNNFFSKTLFFNPNIIISLSNTFATLY